MASMESSTQVELKTFNSVVASNVELKKMSVHQLMSHLLKVDEVSQFSKIGCKWIVNEDFPL